MQREDPMADSNAVPGQAVNDERYVDDIEPDEEVIPFRDDVTSYGADFTVDNIVARLNRGDIVIPTFDTHTPEDGSGVIGFQRRPVWSKPQKDKFIESLLLGFPVPGIFLVAEPNHKYLVLDGQQRLRSLQEYCQERGPALGKVDDQYRDKSYSDLFPADRRRLENNLIHATVVREDSPTTEKTSIYQIFERLNTGGTQLNPQEIRVALYGGEMVRLLSELNRNSDWRCLYGLPENRRLKDQELILRSLAMYEEGKRYERPMKGFLNNYMGSNQTASSDRRDLLRSVFEKTIRQIKTGIGVNAFRLQERRLNAAVLESVFVGVAHRLDRGPIADLETLKAAHSQLIAEEEYRKAVSTGTAQTANVSTRIRLSKEAFAGVR